MHLRTARLCLDCEEVHDMPHCPSCASESFAFLTRWVPTPDRAQQRPRPPDGADPETLSTYREMLVPEPDKKAGGWRAVRRGAVGLALFGLAGWMWRHNGRAPAPPPPADEHADAQ